MGEYLIVHASRTGETQKIAELIAEGIRIAGHSATLKKGNEIKSEEDLMGFDGYAFGSATYHGDMISTMKQVLFIAERAELENLPGGAFGAYGWSADATHRIFGTLEHIFKMKVTSSPLMLKSSGLEGAIPMAQDYGKELTRL